MTDPLEPTAPDSPMEAAAPTSEPTAAPAPAAAGAPAPAASSLMARFDTAGRMIFGGGVVAIVAILVGIAIAGWSVNGFVIVLALAALVAIAVAYLSSPITATDGWSVPGRDITLLAGVVMSVLATLDLIATAFDWDDIDGFQDIVGVVLAIVLAVASWFVLLGAMRAHSVKAVTDAAVRSGDRGTRIALGGLALDLLAWLVMLTISVYALGNSGSFGIGASVLAVLVLVIGGNPAKPWRLPIPASWIAVGLSLIAAFTLLDLFDQFNRQNGRGNLDLIDQLVFYVHALAVLIILAGSVISAIDHQRRTRATPATPSAPGPA